MNKEHLYQQIEKSGHTFNNQQIEKTIIDLLENNSELIKRKELNLIKLIVTEDLLKVIEDFKLDVSLEDGDIKILINNKLDKSLIIKIKNK